MHRQGRPLLLIVDDDVNFLALATDMLVHDGFDVRRATSGAMAIRQFRNEKPDLILLDLRMPVMDGIAFLRAVCSESGRPPAPVVAVSVSPPPPDLKAFDVACFLLKPVDHSALVRVIRDALRKAPGVHRHEVPLPRLLPEDEDAAN